MNPWDVDRPRAVPPPEDVKALQQLFADYSDDVDAALADISEADDRQALHALLDDAGYELAEMKPVLAAVDPDAGPRTGREDAGDQQAEGLLLVPRMLAETERQTREAYERIDRLRAAWDEEVDLVARTSAPGRHRKPVSPLRTTSARVALAAACAFLITTAAGWIALGSETVTRTQPVSESTPGCSQCQPPAAWVPRLPERKYVVRFDPGSAAMSTEAQQQLTAIARERASLEERAAQELEAAKAVTAIRIPPTGSGGRQLALTRAAAVAAALGVAVAHEDVETDTALPGNTVEVELRIEGPRPTSYDDVEPGSIMVDLEKTDEPSR